MSRVEQVDLGGPRLRISYVWRDEVMADAIMLEPTPVTIGTDHHATFTTPDFGLPDNFAVLRPGARGYVLTLGETMRGRVSLGGEELEVADFLRDGTAGAEGKAGAFRATPVTDGDWGVLHLDGTGDHNLFFQFVPAERPLPTARGRDSELLGPAIAFAVILHAILVTITFTLRSDDHSLVFPGRKGVLTEYLVSRPPPPDKPKKKKKGPGEIKAGEKQAKSSNKKPAATRGKAGKSGGKGKRRAKDTQVAKGRPDKPEHVPNVGLTSRHSKKVIDDLLRRGDMNGVRNAMAGLRGKRRIAGDWGKGTGKGGGVGGGSGFGTRTDSKGRGSGGGGKSFGDAKTSGKPLNTGPTRSVKGGDGAGRKERGVLRRGSASGDFGGLSRAEIDKVVRRRQGLIRTCYQRQLNRTRGLEGKIVVSFRIGGDGRVKSARVHRGKSSLKNPDVWDCITNKIRGLRFPKKGGSGAFVNYPFLFSQG